MKNWVLVSGIALLAIFTGFQTLAVRALKNEVRALQSSLASPAEAVADNEPLLLRPPQPRPVSLGNLPQRVTALEAQIASLAKTAQLLVDRGMLPPTQEQAEQLKSRFFDPNASDRDRLNALRLIRRNGQFTDEAAFQAINWLQSATNSNTRRQLLSQLDGATNQIMKQPLLALLGMETDGNIREELVDVLSEFSSDALVEQKLWELAMNDPDPSVREEAHEVLTDGEIPPQRVSAFQARAIDAQLSLDERLMALRGLREAGAVSPEVMSQFATLAQSSYDPVTREKLFRAFDGMNEPTLLPTLVNGLQDANPVVRERAADALGSFSSDPRIQQWLNHIIQNDSDPRVKREAHQALAESQRRRNRRD